MKKNGVRHAFAVLLGQTMLFFETETNKNQINTKRPFLFEKSLW